MLAAGDQICLSWLEGDSGSAKRQSTPPVLQKRSASALAQIFLDILFFLSAQLPPRASPLTSGRIVRFGIFLGVSRLLDRLGEGLVPPSFFFIRSDANFSRTEWVFYLRFFVRLGDERRCLAHARRTGTSDGSAGGNGGGFPTPTGHSRWRLERGDTLMPRSLEPVARTVSTLCGWRSL